MSIELDDMLSCEVSNVDNWAMANKLPLNFLKTKTILVTGKHLTSKLSTVGLDVHIELNRTWLKQVDHIKLLGLELDKDLCFDNHVESLSKRQSKHIGVLNRIN